MDAEKINALVRNLPNFGGIFDAGQLDRVKILGLPVMLVVNTNSHWLGIYIDISTIEIMDSLGELQKSMESKELCRFVCAHLLGKKFLSTPQLQSETSDECGKYAVAFLWYRALTDKSLLDFASVFDKNFANNSVKISKIFDTVTSISNVQK